MKPGQRLRATVAINALEQVLTVPPQAVFDVDDSKVVYVRRASGFEPVEVTLGPSSPGKLVIESGLDEGDRVALRDPTRPDVDHESGTDGNRAKIG
jgi:multidrug efflux pump subunit AcrA (membrane-fusion protein)